MKINWLNRFKNKTVLTGLVGAILLFVKQVTEIFGIDLSEQLEMISGIVGSIITLLVAMGVIVDANSKGVSDSGIALTYSKPRDEHQDPVEFQQNSVNLKEDVGIMTPKDYEYAEPSENDTDEVEYDVAEYEDDETLMHGESAYHDDEPLGLNKEEK